MQATGSAGNTVPDEHDVIGEIGRRIGFGLHFADILHMEVVRERLSEIGITPARATATALVNNRPGILQSELASELRINRASATEMIDQLENLGLIRRVEGVDRRSKELHPTAYGRELYDRFLDISSEIDALLCTGLTEAEVEQLNKNLLTIRRNFEIYFERRSAAGDLGEKK